ncbi:MAG: DUF3891 family protein [Thermoanaerobaculia bacterium]|nr:DUF3891 family protein [Thermoanaerobaculia bacterium]
MIIRCLASTQLLITQPNHAGLARRILEEWDELHFPDSPRKESILRAADHHDDGFAGIDDTLVVDDETGRLLDFIEIPDSLKRETAMGGIEGLTSDPYAAALVAQHRLHVYRRYDGIPEWNSFFTSVLEKRDQFLDAYGLASAEQMLRDYALVRAGDLASLAFCTESTEIRSDGCGYEIRLLDRTLVFDPDPFAGRTVSLAVEGREIAATTFSSAVTARQTLESAPVVSLRGLAAGA